MTRILALVLSPLFIIGVLWLFCAAGGMWEDR